MSDTNALKHGAFADVVILPGEDPNELNELRTALCEEWNPEGPTEIDLVESIAMGMWRKRRFRRYAQRMYARNELTERTFQHHNRASYNRLLSVLEDVETGALTEENLAERANRISEEHPRNKYDSERAWLDVVAHEVMDSLNRLIQVEVMTKPISDEMSAGLLADQEQTSDERLDAKIARDVKTLGQIKTMKAIGIGKSRALATVQPLKQIEAPPIQSIEVDQ
jgi:hypothetical protein